MCVNLHWCRDLQDFIEKGGMLAITFPQKFFF